MHNCSKCSFNSEFDFSVATHEKLNHARNSRRTQFDCADSYVEKHLCPEWDYKTHLKVYLNNHLKKRHKFCSNFHENLAAITEKQCNNCRFKTNSIFLWLLHDSSRERGGNSSLVEQIWLTEETEDIFMNEGKPATNAFEVAFFINTKWFCCNNCSYKSREIPNIQDHIIKEHVHDIRKWHQCDQCSYITLLERNLQNHKLLKHTSNELQLEWFCCDHCDYKSLYKLTLKNHEIEKHLRDDQIEWINCDQCSHKFKSNRLKNYHVRTVHNKDWFYCDQCSFKTYNNRAMLKHKLKHTTDDQFEWFHCPHCSYLMKSENASKHMRRKHSSNVAIFECDKCSFKTQYRQTLRNHEICKHKPADQVKWFNCVQCSYKAKLLKYLNDHVKRVHTSNDTQCDDEIYDR